MYQGQGELQGRGPGWQEDCEVGLLEPIRLGCVEVGLSGGRMLHGGLNSMEVRYVSWSLGVVGRGFCPRSRSAPASRGSPSAAKHAGARLSRTAGADSRDGRAAAMGEDPLGRVERAAGV